MKKFIMGLIIGVIGTISVTAFAAAELNIIPNPFPVLVNGVVTQVDGYNINNSTYLKLSDFKKAGLGVDFDSTNKQIKVTASTVTTSATAPESTINNTEVNKMSTTTQIDTSGLKYIEQDGKKYVDPIDLTKFCESYGFNFDNGSLMESTTNYSIWSQDRTKKISSKGTISVYTFNSIPYFEYDFVINTIIPIMKQ